VTDRVLTLRVELRPSALDARRGVVRLHPEVMAALGLSAWEPVGILGSRVTGALVALAPPETSHGIVLLDDLTCANAGVVPGQSVQVGPATPRPAVRVRLTGGPRGVSIDAAAVRLALLGKVLAPGDNVSLLPQDFTTGPAETAAVSSVVTTLAGAIGGDWTGVLLNAAELDPAGLVQVTMATEVSWDGATPTRSSATPLAPGAATLTGSLLPGLDEPVARLRERLDLGFHHSGLVARLGTTPLLGVLVSGPAGSGKVALVEAVASSLDARLYRLWGPALARADTADALTSVRTAVHDVTAATPSVLLIEDVDAIVPAEGGGPIASVLLEQIEKLVAAPRVAVVCTTAHPEATSRALLRPGLLDLEIEMPIPQLAARERMLAHLCRSLALDPAVDLGGLATRTAGFVPADLLQLTREASLRAAHRLRDTPTVSPSVVQADFDSALEVVRPSALGGETLELADVTLDDVGDMADVKAVLTETVVWPLQHPETFARLGVAPPRGVLLYGPPGCGKTFVVKALAGAAGASFMAVKGAELLSKWVGESERAVRELFRRARGAAPVLLFFDEIDALAPVRGHASDGGTTDRVVAQLLTELDGIEELRGVCVVAATNRPELIDPALLRPGRLDRLVHVPPPDADARSAILTAVVRRMPLAPGIDPAAIGAACEGYSAADLEALAREAALTAMRENLASPAVTPAHFEAARAVVKPSLRPDVIARSAPPPGW
jgi:transitional endoplasmic reticulum ATPase